MITDGENFYLTKPEITFWHNKTKKKALKVIEKPKKKNNCENSGHEEKKNGNEETRGK